MEGKIHKIEKANARIFARAIFRDIAAYIEAHQEEYQAFLRDEMEENDGKITSAHRPERHDGKTK